jgi:hypothetical protein
MRKKLVLSAVLCSCAVAFAGWAAAQDHTNVSGTWQVTIHAVDKPIDEQWVLQQTDLDVVGKVTGASSEQAFSGKVDGTVLHGIIKDGDMRYVVEVSRFKDEMDGTIRMGRNEFLVEAKLGK